MDFKRKFYDVLLDWKKTYNGKNAILIEGARRIGKSTIAETFAKNEYDDYLILDFAKEDSDVKKLFTENLSDLDTFFNNLFVLKQKELTPRKSVIILDEIQLFPQARQAIKYLVADGRFDYIETGSLISIKKKSAQILIPSEEHKCKMYPMDFEEFLWATGDTITAKVIKAHFEKRIPLGDAIHRKIMQTFRTYLAVGGMPQAVKAFVEKLSYSSIDAVKRSILSLYEEDLEKYDDENTEKTSAIFATLAEQLSNHNSMFKLSMVDKNARYQNYIRSIKFLSDSMIANCCKNVTDPQISLELFAESSNIKLFMGDTGLLVTQIMKSSSETESDIYKKLIFDKLGTNLGMIMENMVAQMLRARGYDLYFHEFLYQKKESTTEQKYEVDFLIVKDKRLIPIEVKSSSYKQHESLDCFAKKYKQKKHERFIIYTKDLVRDVSAEVTYIPIYMTMCL
jgi:predicted AAA+ superfamily ATPase